MEQRNAGCTNANRRYALGVNLGQLKIIAQRILLIRTLKNLHGRPLKLLEKNVVGTVDSKRGADVVGCRQLANRSTEEH